MSVKNGNITQMHKSISSDLKNGLYECVICMSTVGKSAKIWSCKCCWAIFHLFCIKKWRENSISLGGSWRCPTCNAQTAENDLQYTCFCGKFDQPVYKGFVVPHSCGSLCGKERQHCSHKCNLLCHPGPCPFCRIKNTWKNCSCGKSRFQVDCGTNPSQYTTCENICEKPLDCNIHFCEEKCHNDKCRKCEKEVEIRCFCEKKSKKVICGENEKSFSCQIKCDRELSCRSHRCQMYCHSGNCPDCQRKPKEIENCACGGFVMAGHHRKHCDDPYLTCNNTCNKILNCGKHKCSMKCHDSPCRSCNTKVDVNCLCGSKTRKVKCSKTKTPLKCKKACRTKMNCGRHHCQITCCVANMTTDSKAHTCKRKCEKTLNCKLHKCGENCHEGDCSPCRVQRREGLSCACGNTKLKGFFFCGQKEVLCKKICRKTQKCGHKCSERCHYGDCPSCSVVIERYCAGNHLLIPCECGQQSSVLQTCDLICGKPLVCQTHYCKRICHVGNCNPTNLSEFSCGNICNLTLKCHHFCRRVCHAPKKCEDLPCKTKVVLKCPCGLIELETSCSEKRNPLECDQKCEARKLAEKFRVAVGFEETSLNGQTINHRDDLWEGLEDMKKYENFEFVFFSRHILELAKDIEISYVKKIEKRIENFVESEEKMIYLDTKDARKRAIIHCIANSFDLMSETVDKNVSPSIRIAKEKYKTIFSKPPAKLSTGDYFNFQAISQYKKGKKEFNSICPFERYWGCVIHVRNHSKTHRTVEALQKTAKEMSIDPFIEGFEMKDIFVICETPEEMHDFTHALNSKYRTIPASFASIRDEIGLSNCLPIEQND